MKGRIFEVTRGAAVQMTRFRWRCEEERNRESRDETIVFHRASIDPLDPIPPNDDSVEWVEHTLPFPANLACDGTPPLPIPSPPTSNDDEEQEVNSWDESSHEREAREEPKPREDEQLDSESDEDGFNERVNYFPIFVQTEVPDSYFDEFSNIAAEVDLAWVEATTTDGPNFLSKTREMLTNVDEAIETPFIGWSISQIYNFWRVYVRPDERNDKRSEQHFTNFVFFCIDQKCSITPGEEEIVIVTDAPDFGEFQQLAEPAIKREFQSDGTFITLPARTRGEAEDVAIFTQLDAQPELLVLGTWPTIVKGIRLPLARAIPCAMKIDALQMTMLEAEDDSGVAFQPDPPPGLVHIDEPGPYDVGVRIASPQEARANKWRAIRDIEEGRVVEVKAQGRDGKQFKMAAERWIDLQELSKREDRER